MKVNVDLFQMQASEISFNDIANAINSENITVSAGSMLQDEMRRTVRVVGDIKNAEELGNIIVKQEDIQYQFLDWNFGDITDKRIGDTNNESSETCLVIP